MIWGLVSDAKVVEHEPKVIFVSIPSVFAPLATRLALWRMEDPSPPIILERKHKARLG
jgi:hypothetical protein